MSDHTGVARAPVADINHTTITRCLQSGNGLAATDDMPPDSTLLRIPNPYLLIPDKASLSRICSWCFFPSVTADLALSAPGKVVGALKACSACRVPRYCSTACQRADWRAIHAKECARLRSLPDIPPTPVRALMRVLLMQASGAAWDPRWAGLEGHLDEMRKGMGVSWQDVLLQASAAVKFSGLEDARVEMAVAILGRISCNAFRVSLPDATPIGLCFEPFIALANHSCLPNAHVVFEGRTVALRSLVPVKRGEELFISYIDTDQPRKARRGEIWETYWFWCHCAKCEEDKEDRSDQGAGEHC